MEKLLEILEKDYKTIEGWCTREKALEMVKHINDDTKLCVELGVFGGKSLLPISLINKGITIGVDAWSKKASLDGVNEEPNNEWWGKIDYDKFFSYSVNLMNTYGCHNTSFLRMESSQAIDFFKDHSIDFLHQDSNHSEKISCMEVELYKNKVKLGGIWVFDDTNWETTKKAQALLTSYGYDEIYDSGTWKIYKRVSI